MIARGPNKNNLGSFFAYLASPCNLPCGMSYFLFDALFVKNFFKKGEFLKVFLSTLFSTASSAARFSDSTVSEDAGIEPRPVATTESAVRRCNHSARSHPLSARSHPLIG
jgi:hypothetical protein